MKISEIMTPDVRTVTPEETVCDAAKIMAEIDAGALPVSEGDRLIGMITDRDIALRCIGERKGPDEKVHEIMTQELKIALMTRTSRMSLRIWLSNSFAACPS